MNVLNILIITDLGEAAISERYLTQRHKGHREKVDAFMPGFRTGKPGTDRTAGIRLSNFSRLYPPLNPL